jgi:glycerol-3-phosphate acyltransferase PlsY
MIMITETMPLLAIAFSYFVGAIPFGLIFGRMFSGIDVRTKGSGNIGATNVLRASGKKAAVLTLVADALKGLIPVLAARILFRDDWITAGTGIAAVLGHAFPVYLKFQGGKGVATSYGVILAVAPWTGLLCLLVWLSAAYLWRYSSLAALISFACYPVLIFASSTTASHASGLLSLFIFGMIYYRHRENIKRLLTGAESKIGGK